MYKHKYVHIYIYIILIQKETRVANKTNTHETVGKRRIANIEKRKF
jgi:hypothetical protein